MIEKDTGGAAIKTAGGVVVGKTAGGEVDNWKPGEEVNKETLGSGFDKEPVWDRVNKESVGDRVGDEADREQDIFEFKSGSIVDEDFLRKTSSTSHVVYESPIKIKSSSEQF